MSAQDPTAEKPIQLNSPARHAAVVIPSDDTDLPVYPRALLIGSHGALRILTLDNEDKTLEFVPVGILPLAVKRVFATGTVASSITALW